MAVPHTCSYIWLGKVEYVKVEGRFLVGLIGLRVGRLLVAKIFLMVYKVSNLAIVSVDKGNATVALAR